MVWINANITKNDITGGGGGEDWQISAALLHLKYIILNRPPKANSISSLSLYKHAEDI